MRKLACVLILCVLGASEGGRLAAASPTRDHVDPCRAAARYQMPEGIETGGAETGVVPAELPDSSAKLEVPDTIAFPLRYQALEDPKFHDSNLDLGRIAVDRPSGAVTLDGIALSDPAEADLQARCKEQSATRAAPRPKQ